MSLNLPYWSPSRERRWVSYWALRLDFPNVSLPKYMDMPELDVFQIHRTEMPEVPEGMTLEWLEVPKFDVASNQFVEDYKLNPIEVIEE